MFVLTNNYEKKVVKMKQGIQKYFSSINLHVSFGEAYAQTQDIQQCSLNPAILLGK